MAPPLANKALSNALYDFPGARGWSCFGQTSIVIPAPMSADETS
jgi:hypothetical protein